MDEANLKLEEQRMTLQRIEKSIKEAFGQLETPRERELLVFMANNGGPQACIEDRSLLMELLSRSGESLSSVVDMSNSRGNTDVGAVRKALLKELAEDVDDAVKKNFAIFEVKMAVQPKHFDDSVQKHSRQIMEVLSSGSHDRIQDKVRPAKQS